MIDRIPKHTFIQLLLKPILLMRLIRVWFNDQILNRPTLVFVDGLWYLQNWGLGAGVWAAISGYEYEPELRPVMSFIKKGHIVLDLGANVGAYTLKMAQQVGETGLVIALEPNQENFKKLENNIKINGFKNIKAFQIAAGDFNGHAELTFEKNFENAASIIHGNGRCTETVTVVRLDDFFQEQNIQKVDFIKMDIEGAEPNALKGLEKIISECRPIILFENSNTMTTEQLSKMGYRTGCFKNNLFTECEDQQNLFAMRK